MKDYQRLRVRDMETGEIFPSVSAAAKAIGVKQPSLREAILKHRSCKGRDFVYETAKVYCDCCHGEVLPVDERPRETLSAAFA